MEKYEAIFKVESKTDALAVERVMNRLYDMLREESREIREGSADSVEMLEQFEAIRDATQRPTPGTLTIVYESKSKEFE